MNQELIEKLIQDHNSLVREIVDKYYKFRQNNIGIFEIFIGVEPQAVPQEVADYTRDFLAGVKEIVEAMKEESP